MLLVLVVIFAGHPLFECMEPVCFFTRVAWCVADNVPTVRRCGCTEQLPTLPMQQTFRLGEAGAHVITFRLGVVCVTSIPQTLSTYCVPGIVPDIRDRDEYNTTSFKESRATRMPDDAYCDGVGGEQRQRYEQVC